jgi:outer membrane protein assembly factor BamA
MIIQGSAEYRFSLIDNVIEAALFADAGNVWSLRRKFTSDPRKLLVASDFLNSIAFNTGVGMRVDFEFFLFRLDWGWQMHNPELDLKDRWVVNEFARNKYFTNYSVLNFGIGYPF